MFPELGWILSDILRELKGRLCGTHPGELSILVETDMKSMRRFLRTVGCVNDSSASCQDHLNLILLLYVSFPDVSHAHLIGIPFMSLSHC